MGERLRLIAPSIAKLAQYEAALEAGWSPDTSHDVSAAQLTLLRRDPAAFLAELTRQSGTIVNHAGLEVPRIPFRLWWMDDGEFCGRIDLRWLRGSEELPPHVSGHIGYAVVPWKRRRGYATRALGMVLPVARQVGLRRLEITCDEDNEASRRVIIANGGVPAGTRPDAASGKTKLIFWLAL
jgi:predicted acetyltransferase